MCPYESERIVETVRGSVLRHHRFGECEEGHVTLSQLQLSHDPVAGPLNVFMSNGGPMLERAILPSGSVEGMTRAAKTAADRLAN